MSILTRNLPRLLLLASFGAWGLIVFYMLAIAQVNVPSIVDDFCFAWMSKEFGIFTGAYYYYMGWSGRYFGNVLMHMSPLYFSGDFTFLQISTYFLIFFGLLSNIYVFRRLSQWPLSDYRLWAGVFLFQATVFYSIPGLYQWFFWFTGIYYYLSFQLILLFFVVYFTLPESRNRSILLAILLFCLMGCSEVSMLMFSGIFWGYQVWIWRFKGPIKKDLYLVFTFWALGFLAVMLSPGNQVRAATNVSMADGIQIFVTHIKLLAYQFFSSPIIWAFLAWVWWGFPTKSVGQMNMTNLLVISILFFGSILVSFIPLSFALGEPQIPARIMSLFLLFLVAYCSFIIIHLKQFVSSKFEPVAFVLVFLLIIFGIKKSDNFQLLRSEYHSGRIQAYATESKIRFEHIRLAQTDSVSVDPIRIQSNFFFNEEFSKDPKHLWCKCVANYYGKKAVNLK